MRIRIKVVRQASFRNVTLFLMSQCNVPECFFFPWYVCQLKRWMLSGEQTLLNFNPSHWSGFLLYRTCLASFWSQHSFGFLYLFTKARVIDKKKLLHSTVRTRIKCSTKSFFFTGITFCWWRLNFGFLNWFTRDRVIDKKKNLLHSTVRTWIK